MQTAASVAAARAILSTRLRVLLVEDEETIAITLCDDLSEHGYDVTLLADGDSAMRYIEAERFHAVISDLRLPGADGLTVLRAARRRQAEARLLLVTAHAKDGHAHAVHAVGGSLLLKPFSNESVLQWLHATTKC